jgi:hypothetical protein
MIVELRHPTEAAKVVIEDDDRVCFAYFIRDGQRTGHVWLYNVLPSPATLEEQERGRAPLNPSQYVKADTGPRPTSPEDFGSNWIVNEEGAIECGIYMFGNLMARLADGEYPGYCSNASADGPLAFTYE